MEWVRSVAVSVSYCKCWGVFGLAKLEWRIRCLDLFKFPPFLKVGSLKRFEL